MLCDAMDRSSSQGRREVASDGARRRNRTRWKGSEWRDCQTGHNRSATKRVKSRRLLFMPRSRSRVTHSLPPADPFTRGQLGMEESVRDRGARCQAQPLEGARGRAVYTVQRAICYSCAIVMEETSNQARTRSDADTPYRLGPASGEYNAQPSHGLVQSSS